MAQNKRNTNYHPADPRQIPGDMTSKPGESLLDWFLRTNRPFQQEGYAREDTPEEKAKWKWINGSDGWREYRRDRD